MNWFFPLNQGYRLKCYSFSDVVEKWLAGRSKAKHFLTFSPHPALLILLCTSPTSFCHHLNVQKSLTRTFLLLPCYSDRFFNCPIEPPYKAWYSIIKNNKYNTTATTQSTIYSFIKKKYIWTAFMYVASVKG